MAHHFDPYDNALVIDGWQSGVAQDPYSGLSHLKSVNIISVPGEASVNFSTSKISSPVISGNQFVASAAANVVTFSPTIPNLDGGMAINFSSVTGFGGALTAGSVYWVGNVVSGTTATLFTDELRINQVTINSTGTATFTVYAMNKPNYFTNSPGFNGRTINNYVIDALGQVWSDRKLTDTNNYWTFTGNISSLSGSKNGNGLVYYTASDGTGYLFAFSDSGIDFAQDNNAFNWIYGWKPSDGTTGNAGGYLKSGAASGNPHEAIVAPDSRVYYTDANWVGRWYQTDPTVAFVPTTKSTYTFDQTALLPTTDLAQCLAFLGTNILVGGKNDVIYPWDRFSSNFNYPLLLSERNTKKLVTVNTNTYIFTGNRGRVYVTNGTQVQLFSKLPDHISGTIEPYYNWTSACSQKNQLYFSASVTTNSSVNTFISGYGGVWAIDLTTKALRLNNELSFANLTGFATALAPILAPTQNTNQPGSGLFIGWNDSTNTYGLDTTSSSPYTNSNSVIETDLIPIGTYTKPRDLTLIEYKLTKPMVSGESVTINYRLNFSQAWTQVLSDSSAGNFSNYATIDFKNAQWVQFQVVLNSTGSSPSFTRLKQIRVLGLVAPYTPAP